MTNLNNTVKEQLMANIISILAKRGSKATLSNKKIKSLLKQANLGIKLSDEDVEYIISNLPINKNVSMDKTVVNSGEESVQDEEEKANDEVHNTAVETAMDNMEEGLKVGTELDPSKFELNESNDLYHLHNAAKYGRMKYVIESMDKNTISCSIKGTSYKVQLPREIVERYLNVK